MQTSFQTAHSRSFERTIDAEGHTQALGPIVYLPGQYAVWRDGAPNLDESKGLVRGSLWIKNAKTKSVQHADLDARNVTIPMTVLAQIVTQTPKSNQRAIRVISRANGNSAGAGTADAILFQVTGTKELDALAEQYSFAVAKTVKTGQNGEFEEVLTNPIAITLPALLFAAQSPFAVPPQEKAQSFSRMDRWNPDLLEAVAFYQQTGDFPERATASSANVDDEFVSELNIKPREPRVNPRAGASNNRVPNAGRRPAASDDYI